MSPGYACCCYQRMVEPHAGTSSHLQLITSSAEHVEAWCSLHIWLSCCSSGFSLSEVVMAGACRTQAVKLEPRVQRRDSIVYTTYREFSGLVYWMVHRLCLPQFMEPPTILLAPMIPARIWNKNCAAGVQNASHGIG
eukprot:606801-Pelagomonas_calceolata.AAC.6